MKSLIVAAVLFTNLAFAADGSPDPQPPKPATGSTAHPGEGMTDAQFRDWVTKPLAPDETGDECSNAKPHFAFNSSTDPQAHAFDCRQEGPERDWYRQRVRGLRVKQCPDKSINGGCDATFTRVCRESAIGHQGVKLPEQCPGEGGNTRTKTGPNGCGVCGTATYKP